MTLLGFLKIHKGPTATIIHFFIIWPLLYILQLSSYFRSCPEVLKEGGSYYFTSAVAV